MKLMYKMFIFVFCFSMLAVLVAALSGSGQTGRLTYWSASDTIASDAELYWNYTNNIIGIGDWSATNGPKMCTGCTAPGVAMVGDNPGIRLKDSTGVTSDYLLYNNDDKFYIWDLADSASRLMVDSFGKVGIGTTTPSTKLDVAGDLNVAGYLYVDQLVNDGSGIFYDSVSIDYNDPAGTISISSINDVYGPHAEIYSSYIVGSDSRPLAIETLGYDNQIWLSNRSNTVGIATSQPDVDVTLDVNGPVRTRATTRPTCDSSIAGTVAYEVVSNVGTFYGCAQTGSTTYEWKSLQN